MSKLDEPSVDRCFLEHAALSQSGFFAALSAAGHPDLSQSPLAAFVYRGSCSKDGESEASLPSLQRAVHDASAVHALLPQNGSIVPGDDFADFGRAVLNVVASRRLNLTLENDPKEMEAVRSILDDEAFARYDTDGDGRLDKTESLAFALTVRALCDAYEAIALRTDREGDGGEKGSMLPGLDPSMYANALRRIGLPDLERTFRGQFVSSVFSRADLDKNGRVTFSEFVRAGTRFAYPVLHQKRIRSSAGYPGWKALAAAPPTPNDAEEISTLVKSLRTGDLILMQGGEDGMGQYIKFSLDTPWSHVAVVVKRMPLTGTANEKTEEFLQRYPFRRSAHHFCSPGYCRCYDPREGDFASSKLAGCGDVGLLESTGEGIHLYDLAHRLFEGPKQWVSIAVARLHDAPGRDDNEKIRTFVESVRGGIYTVAKDELKAAISFHDTSDHDDDIASESSSGSAAKIPEGGRSSDDFCASVVMRFYRHMGWVTTNRPDNSVMPSDFDVPTAQSPPGTDEGGSLSSCDRGGGCSRFSYPVELAEGKGHIGPLEIVTCPDLGARLPLKFPRKK